MYFQVHSSPLNNKLTELDLKRTPYPTKSTLKLSDCALCALWQGSDEVHHCLWQQLRLSSPAPGSAGDDDGPGRLQRRRTDGSPCGCGVSAAVAGRDFDHSLCACVDARCGCGLPARGVPALGPWGAKPRGGTTICAIETTTVIVTPVHNEHRIACSC